MPLYDYRCSKCNEVFEVRQKFAYEPLTVHENCGGSVERLISTSMLMFKGSGFYINDYAKSGNGEKKPEAKTETKSDSKAESKGESKGESKPSPTPAATTTPTKPKQE